MTKYNKISIMLLIFAVLFCIFTAMGAVSAEPTVSTNLTGGTYNTTQTVALTSNDTTATTYYANDTTDPRTSPTRIAYTGAITIDRTTTLRYASVDTLGNWSQLYLQNYVIGTGGLADTPWPTFQENNNHTGQSNYTGPQTNNTKWTYTTSKSIPGSPAIGADGTIYIGSTDRKLYAINPDGTLKWTFTTSNSYGKIEGSPTIGIDGTIYIADSSGSLYAINPDGTQKWNYTPSSSSIYGGIAIGVDGTIYFVDSNKKIYALNPDGTKKWEYFSPNDVYVGTPAIGSDGTIYIGNYDGNLYAFNCDGTVKWTYTTGDHIYYSSPAIGADGTIYFVCDNGDFYALNPDGSKKWNFTTGIKSYSRSPAIGAGGTIYIGYSTIFFALNPDGTQKWNYTISGGIRYSTIGADGTIYLSGGSVVALNPDGSLKWSYKTGSSTYGPPAIGSNGTLYFGAGDYKIYAIEDDFPEANFTITDTYPPSGWAPLTVHFKDTSYCPASWYWDFGDGTNSTEQNPTHTYTTPGNYTVSLTVSNPLGNSTKIQNDLVKIANTTPLTVDIDLPGGIYSTTQTATLNVNDPTATIYYTLDTTDPRSSSTRIQYTGALTLIEPLTLMFAAVNPEGYWSSLYTQNYIIGTANFTTTDTYPPSGWAPLTVHFKDTTVIFTPTSWYWDFGDGTNSTEQNPTHTYTTPGNYTVSLTASNDTVNSTITQSNYVRIADIAPLTVTSSLPSGTYNSTQATALIASDPAATIYYTLDTTDPRSSSTRIQYTGALTLIEPLTLMFAAVNPEGYWSSLFVQGYAIGNNGLTNSDWPTLGGNTNNTGQSNYVAGQTNTLKWSYTTGNNIYYSCPTIGTDGTIYVGSYDGKLYAINPNGTLKWIYSTGTSGTRIYGSALIGKDGTIYFGSYNRKFYALYPNGTEKWIYTAGGRIYGSPAIGTDGTIYFGADNSRVYALNPNGTLKWTFTTGTLFYSSPVVGADGTIYIGDNSKLYALYPYGTLKWSYATGGSIQGSPSIGTDGTIYVGIHNGNFYALNPDGTLKWNYTAGGGIYYAYPAIGTDGTIYIGNTNGNFYALNPDGTLKWSYVTGGSIYGSAVIGADGIIYFGSNDKKVYALNPNGTLKWTYSALNFVQGSPSIGADGTLYIGSHDKKLYAFKDQVPAADFIVTAANNGTLTVQFNDTSSYAATWAWDFDNDGTVDSTEQNPAFTYSNSGSYTVKLTVTNVAGSDDEVKYVTVDNVAPVPSADLASGSYNTDLTVNLSATDNMDSNPTIYYTLDGSDPTTSSTLYTGPINLNNEGTTTLKFIAVDFTGNISNVTERSYTIDKTMPTATANPVGGAYNDIQTVTITTTDINTTTTYYTTDGSDPQTSSTRTEYTGPITINTTTTLKFFAIDAADNPSPVYTETYTVNITPIDLKVESVTTSGNTATGVSNYTVTGLIQNYGSSVQNTFYVSYYLSTDQSKSSNDRYIGHATINGLNGWSSTNAQFNCTIPKDIAQGNYYIIAVADVTGLVSESNEANNNKTSNTTIFVWRPDIRVNSITTNGNTATGVSNYSVTGLIQNYGSFVSDTFYVSYYLSTDTTKSSNDRYIGHATVNGLDGWTTTNTQVNCTIPKDIAQGNYYIIAVADVTGVVPESYETNNNRASASSIFVWRPDLRVNSVTTSGNTFAGATNYTVTSSIQNYGSTAQDTFYVSYYLSTDTTKSSNDRYIGHATVNGLDGWTTTNTQFNCTIPQDITQGNYYIIAVADVTSLIPESYETNNIRVSSSRIYISKT